MKPIEVADPIARAYRTPLSARQINDGYTGLLIATCLFMGAMFAIFRAVLALIGG